MSPSTPSAPARLSVPFAEFIAMVAVLMALNALAIDIMLPALPDIAADLNVTDVNDRQTVITAYLISFGIAQLVFGPFADRFGRKPVLIIGLLIYSASGILSVFAATFQALLAARLIQGIGGAAPRVLALAVVRDCFDGRQMARVMSLVMMVFIAVPVVAPSVGQVLIMAGHWHWIFALLTIGGFATIVWMWLRLPETLAPENRARLSLSTILANYRTTLTTRETLGYMIVAALMFGGMFGFLNSSQQIFVDLYGTGAAFPLIFALIALAVSVASLINSGLVMRLGMRVLAHFSLVAMTTLFVIHSAIALAGLDSLYTFIPLMAAAMFCFGLLLANVNTLALIPVGHIAGSASAMVGFVGTTGGAILGYFIGQAFNGTILPLTVGFALLGFASIVTVLITEKGRMFKPGDGAQT